nr:MAG TPA: hypothetical protein [Caudoviricetes sp.]
MLKIRNKDKNIIGVTTLPLGKRFQVTRKELVGTPVV